jgi:hypothetical protein
VSSKFRSLRYMSIQTLSSKRNLRTSNGPTRQNCNSWNRFCLRNLKNMWMSCQERLLICYLHITYYKVLQDALRQLKTGAVYAARASAGYSLLVNLANHKLVTTCHTLYIYSLAASQSCSLFFLVLYRRNKRQLL